MFAQSFKYLTDLCILRRTTAILPENVQNVCNVISVSLLCSVLQHTLINCLCVGRLVRYTICNHFWVGEASFFVVKLCVVNSKATAADCKSSCLNKSSSQFSHSTSITSRVLSFTLPFLTFCKGSILISLVRRPRKLIPHFSSASKRRSTLTI